MIEPRIVPKVHPDRIRNTPPILSRSHNDVSLRILSTGPLSLTDPHTTLIGLPWSEYVDRADANVRYAAIQQVLSGRVVAIDNPGVAPETNLSESMTQSITHGSLDDVSKVQLSVGAERLAGELTAVGYSMGAMSVMNMLAQESHDIVASRLILFESVGVKPVKLPKLARLMHSEAKQRSNYVTENPEWFTRHIPTDTDAAKSIWQQRKANLAFARAIRSAPLIADITRAYEVGGIQKETEVIIMNGERSAMSPEATNTQLEQAFRSLGMQAIRRIELAGESHGLIDSLPKFAGALKLATA